VVQDLAERETADLVVAPRTSVSREVNDFLVELSVALHKHGMYPLGHPSLGPAAESVTRQAERLMGGNEILAFGVARHQLIVDGVATDPQQPVLRRLAESLHRYHLGAISLLRGLHPDEVATILRALAVEPDRPDQEGAASQLPQCPHIRLHPLTFDGLTIGANEPEDDVASSASRSAILWVGLAQAAMAGEEPAGAAATPEPDAVADAIDRHHGAEAYDQVVVGYLLQIAAELKSTTGTDAEALRRRTARLISALKPETLRRLLTMGGHSAQRNQFVLDATHGMAVDSVIDIVKAAADANGQTISHGLMRMLTKLSTQAESGHDAGKSSADSALREQVQRLLSDWELADPNPDDYRHMLQYLATAVPTGARHEQAAESLNALRLVQMSLEVGTWGPLVDRAITTCVKEGGAPALVAMLGQVPDGSSECAERLRASLAQPLAIGAIASQEPLDEATLDYLMPFLSIDGYGALLDVLASSQSRVTRRKLLDRLARTTLDVVGIVARRLLKDNRWYVQRNMLLLLARLGRVPEGFQVAPWVGHIDPRVRVEALRLQVEQAGQREIALRTALRDTDPRVVRVGVAAAQQDCPARVVPFLIEVVQGTRMPEDVRLAAVQALGRSRERTAFDALLALVDGGRNIIGRRRLLPKSPMLVAGLRALATTWRSDPIAASLVALAAASTDEDLRGAVR
jgi:hypothetical protein